MNSAPMGKGEPQNQHFESVCCKRIAFFAVFAVWLALDMLVKSFVVALPAGSVLYESPLHFINIIVAHNTGGAWSIFAGAPVALGVFSLIICAILFAAAMLYASRLSLLFSIASALVVAGGIGNVIDRFVRGYVIDYIAPAFIDFPVFNVADIGVTVGMVFLVISLLIAEKRNQQREQEAKRG